MPRRPLALTALLATLALASVARAAPAPINAVVGDASWIERHGRPPTYDEARARDDERHRVHLAWIERRLRAAPVAHLDAKRRATRAFLLDALAAYRERGVHPVNDRAERLPRFLDPDGRVCAVGFLMEVSAGRELVERINARWEHDYLREIDDPELSAWIATSGFTVDELASIQPTGYAGPGLGLGDPDGGAWLGGVAGALLLAADVALLAFDLSERRRRGRARTEVAATQVALGTLQLGGSIATFAHAASLSSENDWRTPLYASAALASAFSLIHVASGAASLATPEPARPRLSLAPLDGGAMLSLGGRL